MSRFKKIFFSFALTQAILQIPAHAEPLIIDVIKKPTPIPIIVHGFSCGENILDKNFVKILAQDLELYADKVHFQTSHSTQPVQEAYIKPHFKDYQHHAGIQTGGYFIVGLCEEQGSSLKIKFRIFNMATGLLFKEGIIEGNASQWRTLAHRVADSLLFLLTKKKGCFEMHLLGEALLKSRDKKTHTGIGSLHQDGTNFRALVEAKNNSTAIYAPSISTDGRFMTYLTEEKGASKTILHIYDMEERRESFKKILPEQAVSTSFIPNTWKVVLVLVGNQLEFWSCDLTTGALRLIKKAPSFDFSPNYHPNGQKFLFCRKDASKPQIYLQDGERIQRVSKDASSSYTSPCWSPDGLWISFIKRKKNNYYLGVMAADGSQERAIAKGFDFDCPAWAPNSELIVFSSRENKGGKKNIYIVNFSGSVLRKINFGPSVEQITNPAWISKI